jgi:hypothetical protein
MNIGLRRSSIAGAMLTLLAGVGMAQGVNRQVVVADATNRQPVVRASLYSKEAGGSFHSAVSNEQGVAVIAFSFQRLTVSHLNYEKRIISHLPDTIFLTPKFQTKAEVVITNKEPEWIRRKLKQVVKQKEQHYFSHDGHSRIDYFTQSIGTNSLYRMHMGGVLRMKSHTQKRYALLPDTANIVAADSTQLTDTQNLRRMLYEDFVAELDAAFIRNHRFSENPSYQGRSASEIELRFRSKSLPADDHGWIVVDTARCVILKAIRHTGTKTNRQERTDALLYHFARLMGYRIDTWTRDYRVSYGVRSDGTFYPDTVSYKFYYAGHDSTDDKQQEEFNKQTGGGFPNMEATLTLQPTNATNGQADEWHELPPSWYIKYNTDADRRQEIELSGLPAIFTIYEHE